MVTGSMLHVYETIIKKLHCLKSKSFLKVKPPDFRGPRCGVRAPAFVMLLTELI